LRGLVLRDRDSALGRSAVPPRPHSPRPPVSNNPPTSFQQRPKVVLAHFISIRSSLRPLLSNILGSIGHPPQVGKGDVYRGTRLSAMHDFECRRVDVCGDKKFGSSRRRRVSCPTPCMHLLGVWTGMTRGPLAWSGASCNRVDALVEEREE
jgi:hypothetical protein